jgi:hypothetical protein
MPSGPGERYDFFVSRRGSVAAVAQEVTDVLKEKGYKVRTQDYCESAEQRSCNQCHVGAERFAEAREFSAFFVPAARTTGLLVHAFLHRLPFGGLLRDERHHALCQ